MYDHEFALAKNIHPDSSHDSADSNLITVQDLFLKLLLKGILANESKSLANPSEHFLLCARTFVAGEVLKGTWVDWCSVTGQRCCQALMALQLYCKYGGAHAKKTKQWMDGSLLASDSVEMREPYLFKSWERVL